MGYFRRPFQTVKSPVESFRLRQSLESVRLFVIPFVLSLICLSVSFFSVCVRSRRHFESLPFLSFLFPLRLSLLTLSIKPSPSLCLCPTLSLFLSSSLPVYTFVHLLSISLTSNLSSVVRPSVSLCPIICLLFPSLST